MEWISRISAIEARAKGINLSLHELCNEAGVRPNNITRWKQGVSPNVSTLDRVLKPLEELLDRKEQALLRALSRRARPRTGAAV